MILEKILISKILKIWNYIIINGGIKMNKVILMGRLTKDVELKYTPSNIAVGNFTIAIDRRFAKQGEEKKQTDFIPIVVWNKTAEFCSKYFKKGSKVLLAGRLQVRTWDDTDGKKHWVTEVIAEEVDFADSNNSEKKTNNVDNSSKENAPVSNENNGFYPLDVDDELPF